MICPKCDVGRIEKIILKSLKQEFSSCESCGTIWFKDEIISSTSGHALSGLRASDKEYMIARRFPDDPDTTAVRFRTEGSGIQER